MPYGFYYFNYFLPFGGLVLNLGSEFGYWHINSHPDANIKILVAAAVLLQILHLATVFFSPPALHKRDLTWIISHLR